MTRIGLVCEGGGMKCAYGAAILDKFLDDMYSYYTDVGFIPLDKLHQARRIYDCYHSLGGNGTGTAEINKLELLPIVRKK